jgi:hypothetical protein
LSHDRRTRGIGEPFELAEMLVEELERPRPLRRRADQQRALDGRGDGDQFA